jgi:hypothetical protein
LFEPSREGGDASRTEASAHHRHVRKAASLFVWKKGFRPTRANSQINFFGAIRI